MTKTSLAEPITDPSYSLSQAVLTVIYFMYNTRHPNPSHSQNSNQKLAPYCSGHHQNPNRPANRNPNQNPNPHHPPCKQGLLLCLAPVLTLLLLSLTSARPSAMQQKNCDVRGKTACIEEQTAKAGVYMCTAVSDHARSRNTAQCGCGSSRKLPVNLTQSYAESWSRMFHTFQCTGCCST